jgi:hypothetical protein
VRLGGPPRRQPRPALRGEDERPRALAHEREPAFERAGPQRQPGRLQLARKHAQVADEAELREAEQLVGREGPRSRRLADPAVRDQLDDVARGVVEVARERVPEGEVEDDLATFPLRQQLDTLPEPLERGLEAVAGSEQGEVVERLARRRAKLEPRRADPSAREAEPLAVELVERRDRRRRRVEPDLDELEGDYCTSVGMLAISPEAIFCRTSSSAARCSSLTIVLIFPRPTPSSCRP